jgi:electron transfer flavoprotein-quinone oxidoreductase
MLSRREIFEGLPALCDDIAGKVFTVDGKPGMNIIMYMVDAIARRTSATELMNLVTTVLEAF